VRPVLLCLADLWGHVEWCTDVRGGKIVGLEDLGEAEIAELDAVVVAEEDCDCEYA
jgi:hypothetical protein